MGREEAISRDPEVVGGTLVFAGTRVPVHTETINDIKNYPIPERYRDRGSGD